MLLAHCVAIIAKQGYNQHIVYACRNDSSMPKPQDPNNNEPQFHLFRLLAVILGVVIVIAVICYALQLYYLGPG